MEDLLKSLIDATSKDADADVQIEEWNQKLNVSYYSRRDYLCNYSILIEKLNRFPYRDSYQFEIRDVTENGVFFSNSKCSSEDEYKEFIKMLEKDDELSITLDIKKGIKENKLSVYSINDFISYFLNLGVIEMLKFVEEDLKGENQLVFELFNSEMFIATKSMVFRPFNRPTVVAAFDRKQKMEECHKNCYVFGDWKCLPIPEDFHFVVESDDNPFLDKFKRLETMLSLVYITDNVQLQEESISCQLYGKRMNTMNIKYTSISYNPILYDIYYWMYTDGNIVDKVSLARNLLSLHCKNIALNNLDEQTFMSLKANFAIYQKENVDKYIELKNKMTEFLMQTLAESRDIVVGIVGDIGKNIIAFFSFGLTAFFSGIISERGLGNVFTKEVTAFSYLICVGSLVYVIITNCITNYKVKRLSDTYQTIKESNDFLEGTKEYEEVFDEKKLKETINSIRRTKCCLNLLWIAIIILVFATVSFLSNYGAKEWIAFLLK